MKTFLSYCFLIVVFMLSLPDFMAVVNATTRYVKPTASGTGNGSNWANASADLQAMINASAEGDSVWVAAGTYKPTQDPFGNSSPSNPRDRTFFVKDGVKLYGGFAGTEATLTARNIPANPTTLSGDIGAVGNASDNAYHVVFSSAPFSGGTGVTIDGFTITGGNANGSGNITVNGNTIPRYSGGGIYTIYGTNTLSNNTLSGNTANTDGGGIYTLYGTNTLSNNTLLGNSANQWGGGIFTYSSTNTLNNNTLSGNSANIQGGAIYTDGGTNTLSNNTLSGNSANFGGGIYTSGGTNTLSNNTLSGNSAAQGGGILTAGGTNTLSNNTLSGNTANQGGGIYTQGGTNTLSNNTLSGNSANQFGGGIYTFVGTNTIVNNLFWDNKLGGNAATQGADYYREFNSANTFTNNLLQLASSNYTTTGSGFYDLGTGAAGNLFAQDPLFADAANPAGPDGIHRTADDGLRLQAGSPCINNGIASLGSPNVVPATDILGTTRPQGSGVDMGAYETACNATANITGTATGCGSVTLTATGGTSYAWSGGSTPNQATNTFTTSNTYSVTVTDNIGCTATASQVVTVNTLPAANITNNTGTTVLTCTTTAISITATGGTGYQWSGGDTPTTADNTFTQAGEYTVTVTNDQGCTATTNINITGTILCPDCTGTPGGTALPGTACNDGNANTANDVYDANCNCAGTPILCNLGATLNGNTNLCAGGVIGLVATGGNQYQWSGPNGFAFSGGNITRTNATVAMSGVYTVTISNNSCTVTLSKVVTVHPIPSATITGATAVCSGGSISLSAPAGAVGYAWSGPGGFTASGATMTRTPAVAGTYTVTVTGAGGCTATATRSVSVSAPTAAAVTGATTLCANAALVLTCTTTGVGYQWSGPGGFSFSGAAMTRTPAVAGVYTVTVTNALGCISTASRTVTVNASPNLTVTNNSNCTRVWLVASGGNSYVWSGPNGYTVFGTTVLRNPATASMFGVYTVTVTGNGGCTASASITVNPCSGKTQSLPPDLSLSAYPNPTPGIVHISFTNVEAEEVMLAIYTAEGKEVNTLFTGIAEAYTNYTLRFDGSYLPNGVYYAVLRRAGGATEQLPIMVVK